MYKTKIYYLIAIMFAAHLGTACSSTDNLRQSEEFHNSLEGVDRNIDEVVTQIDAVRSSLNALTDSNQSDLESAFDNYSGDVEKIIALENAFAEHFNALKSNGDAYFDNWDTSGTQYINPEIQSRSNERRAEVYGAYELIKANSAGVQEAFQAYVIDVREIETFLANDLTRQGINSISSTANTTIRNGENLLVDFDELQLAIRETKSKMDREGVAIRN